MSRHPRAAGFTLVELLIALVVFALLATSVAQFARSMLRGVRVLEAASEAQMAARLGAQLIAGELRDAGFHPAGTLGNGLRRAAPEALALVRDLNGDGDSADAGEAVGFQHAAAPRVLQRVLGSAPPQPLLNDVPVGGLRFVFRDAAGAVLGGGGELDDAARARVRRVDTAVTVEIRNPDPAATRPLRGHHVAVAWLRNG